MVAVIEIVPLVFNSTGELTLELNRSKCLKFYQESQLNKLKYKKKIQHYPAFNLDCCMHATV